MEPTDKLHSLAHTADAIKSAVLAIVLRHHGLELHEPVSGSEPD
jgi:hypothetical protein